MKSFQISQPAYPLNSSSDFEIGIGIEIAIESDTDPDFDPDKNATREVDNHLSQLLTVKQIAGRDSIPDKKHPLIVCLPGVLGFILRCSVKKKGFSSR